MIQLKRALEEYSHNPGRYNLYLFYASDGENFREDRKPALNALHRLTAMTAFSGYLETSRHQRPGLNSETAALFNEMSGQGRPVDSYGLAVEADVWEAIRRFFAGAPTDGEM